MRRIATAEWRGGIKDGQGTVSVGSGAFDDLPYSFSTRFEDKQGTNPEELIAAAHAACFSMALSAELSKANFPPQFIETSASVTLEQDGGKWNVNSSHLDVSAAVPKIERAQFIEIANSASKNCPISRLLKAEITLRAELNEAVDKPAAASNE